MTEFLGIIKGFADYGVMGLVTLAALYFAFYQTRRIEQLTDQLIKATTGALMTAAQLFDLNKEGGTDDKETKPRRGSSPGLPVATEPLREDGKATKDSGQEDPG